MRYWPLPSVTAVRVCSMRLGLDASTVTPGSTAPEPSVTTPAIAACAIASLGTHHTQNAIRAAAATRCDTKNLPLHGRRR
jgi:hypothetical protein